MEDLYTTLGVARGASSGEIKKAYRALARELHPDRNPDDQAAEDRFKKVAYAYEVLHDEDKRKLYDEFGEAGLKEGFDADQYRQYQRYQEQRHSRGFGHHPGGAGGDGAGFSFDVGDLFGGNLEDLINAQQRRGPRRGPDTSATLRLGFLEALHGGERELTFGHGKHMKVRFPKGARDGDILRLKGQGNPGPRGGPPGDLLLTLEVAPHPVLRREEDDLHINVPITLAEAYRGAKIRIPVLDGEVTLTVPAGAQAGSTLRLRGKGVARGGKTGDLYVHLEPQLPPKGKPETETVLEGLEGQYEDIRGKLKL
jgi:curved DNA-binding protein